MITLSESQQKIVNALEAVNNAHWIDNHNGTISCVVVAIRGFTRMIDILICVIALIAM